MNPLGGGERNQFGLDFHQQGKTWTKQLCQMDSDGDGMTNGQELGDPDCEWTVASEKFPSRTTGITHPGVCDPWGSTLCAEKNADISCDTGEFVCPAVHEPHVRNFTLRFPKTNVPPEETSYMCMSFELEFPEGDSPEQEYHIIGTQPIIDNANVMHHIVLSSCSETAAKVSEPTLCYMSQEGCFSFIGLWTLGMPGECIYKDAGYKIGGSKSINVMMQFHWTNPERRTDFFDESGMIVYYTPELRKYNAGLLTVGEQKLEIPPGRSRVVYQSTCKSECTQKGITDSVYITSGLNHMHYLGIQQNVELYRGGKHIRDLTKEEIYSYDNPVVHTYDPPQVLLPGDELKTTCVYRSLSRKRTTLFGEGTYEEMCYGLLTVFPVENMTMGSCVTWGDIDECSGGSRHIGDCDRWAFMDKKNANSTALKQLVLDSCNYYGKCREECPGALSKANEHPCLQGKARDFITWSLSLRHFKEDAQFLAALSSCDCQADRHGRPRVTEDKIPVNRNHGQLNGAHLMAVLVSSLLGVFVKY